MLRDVRVVLDRSQTPDPKLILNSIEDFVDKESERSELLCRPVGSEQARKRINRLGERIRNACLL